MSNETLSTTQQSYAGPSFATALCGFLGTTAATTLMLALLASF